MQKLIQASRVLSQLNGVLSNFPNPTFFLDSIHLQEVKYSSEIENIITTNDDLYRNIVSDKKVGSPAVKEVLRYKQALWLGLIRIEKRPFLSTNLWIEIVQCIKQNDSGISVTPGTVLANTAGDIFYTPPTGKTSLV